MRHIPLIFSFFYRPQRSCGQGYFLIVSVILLTGGSVSVHAGKEAPPWERSSACWEGSPMGKTQCMLGRKHPPPGKKQCMLGRKHTLGKKQCMLGRKHPPPPPANKRPVRILLECILVDEAFCSSVKFTLRNSINYNIWYWCLIIHTVFI